MRIALVSYEYPPQNSLGGVGTYMARLAAALGRSGHDVHVLAAPADSPEVALPNVTVHRIPAVFNPRTAPRPLRWLYWHLIAQPLARAHPMIWHWLRWDLACHQALKEISRLVPFDVIEAPEHAGNGLAAGYRTRAPLSLRIHCPWETFVRVNHPPINPMHCLLASLERYSAAACASAITLPSRAMLHEIQKSWKLPVPPSVIPNFMDVPAQPAPLPPPDGPQQIVCTGRLEPLKGQDVLVRAFALIARRHPHCQLWLIGPDRWGKRPFARLLSHLVPDASIRCRIHMPGQLPFGQIALHLQRAAIFVTPSVGFESFSYSTLEAMAAARPIIVARTGALPELITHEQTGLVVPPSDHVALSNSLDQLLSNRDAAEAISRSAHAAALARYNTPLVLPQMIRAYEVAIDRFRRCAAATPIASPTRLAEHSRPGFSFLRSYPILSRRFP